MPFNFVRLYGRDSAMEMEADDELITQCMVKTCRGVGGVCNLCLAAWSGKDQQP